MNERGEAIPARTDGSKRGLASEPKALLSAPLYAQVLVAVVLGSLLGFLWPAVGQMLKPLGDVFVRLVKMIIAPVIFCTVSVGIARMGDVKEFGRVGGKALLYFEIVSSLALVIGLAVAFLAAPGVGFGLDPTKLDLTVAAGYAVKASEGGGVIDHLIHFIPETFFGAFASGDILQVLFLAVLTGFACSKLGATGVRAAAALEDVAQIFFAIIHILVRASAAGRLWFDGVPAGTIWGGDPGHRPLGK